jgi:hypothetical protein
MKTKTMTVLMGTIGLMVLGACSSQKEPATQAVANLETSLAAVKADGERFASDASASVERKVDELRAALDKKDYKTVVARAPEVEKDISALRENVAVKRKELEEANARATETWNGFSAEMPRYLDTLQKRVDALAKRARNKAPSEDSLLLANIRNLWADAGNLFSTGKPVEATARAEEARAKAQELAQKINAKLE